MDRSKIERRRPAERRQLFKSRKMVASKLQTLRINLEEVVRLVSFTEGLKASDSLQKKLLRVIEESLQECISDLHKEIENAPTTREDTSPPPSPIPRRFSDASSFQNSLPPLHPPSQESILSAAERGQVTPIALSATRAPGASSVCSRSTSGRMNSRYNTFLSVIIPFVKRAYPHNKHNDNFKLATQLWTICKGQGDHAAIINAAKQYLQEAIAAVDAPLNRTVELSIPKA